MNETKYERAADGSLYGGKWEVESYEDYRIRMQAESPDPERCEHGMSLRTRCIRCDEDERYYGKHGRFGEPSNAHIE